MAHWLVMLTKRRLKTAWNLVQDTYSAYTRDNASRLAASIAFYAVFSVAPLLIIAAAIGGVVFGDHSAQAELAGYLQRFTSPDTSEYIQELIRHWQNKSTGVVATAIGLGTLFWGAYRLFMALQDTLNMIWEVRPRSDVSIKTWIRIRLIPFSLVGIIGLLLLASMVATAVLSAIQTFFAGVFPVPAVVVNAANFVVGSAVITVLFAAVFKILPDVNIEWRAVWIGAAVTALLFSVGRMLIGFYLGYTSITSIFGAAGSLVALLFWVYFSAQIFFAGAEFTQIHLRYMGGKIVPEDHAVRVERERTPHRDQRRTSRPGATYREASTEDSN